MSSTIAAWIVVMVAVIVLAGCTFAALRYFTTLPAWAEAIISFPAGVILSYWFAKTHETNGFDGPLAPSKPISGPKEGDTDTAH